MLENIFGLPQFVVGVGNVYPVKLKDYINSFMMYSWILKYDKKHTGLNDEDDYSNFNSILFRDFSCPQLKDLSGTDSTYYKIHSLQEVISIVTKESVRFDYEDLIFYIGDGKHRHIGEDNFDAFREIVMDQNIIHPEKYYKDSLVAKWITKAKETRAKKDGGLALEDIISTVSNLKHVPYNEILDFTYYQLITDFYRLAKIMNHKDSVVFASQVGTKQVPVSDFTESLRLKENEDDKLIKKASEVIGGF